MMSFNPARRDMMNNSNSDSQAAQDNNYQIRVKDYVKILQRQNKRTQSVDQNFID